MTPPHATAEFWVLPSIYAHTLSVRTTKFDVVTHMGRDIAIVLETYCQIFRHAHIPRGRNPSASHFGGSALLMFTPFDIERTTKFDDVVTHGEKPVLRGQPQHCILSNASRGLSVEFLVFFELSS